MEKIYNLLLDLDEYILKRKHKFVSYVSIKNIKIVRDGKNDNSGSDSVKPIELEVEGWTWQRIFDENS